MLSKLPRTGDLVFPGFDDRSARATAWRAACSKAGATGVLMRHTRTTAIRNLTNKGVPLQRIMQMTGHKSLPTHMGYNVSDEKDLDLIRKLYDKKL